MNKVCEFCQEPFKAKDYRSRFCSQSHSAKYNNAARGLKSARPCKNKFCTNKVQRTSKSSYCNKECRQSYLKWMWYHNEWAPKTVNFPRWLRDMVVLSGCTICGWGERNPLSNRPQCQLDHINGDCRDHRYSNIRVLCPNHHSLTPTFGALNKMYKS